jgi:hypothetical protein
MIGGRGVETLQSARPRAFPRGCGKLWLGARLLNRLFRYHHPCPIVGDERDTTPDRGGATGRRASEADLTEQHGPGRRAWKCWERRHTSAWNAASPTPAATRARFRFSLLNVYGWNNFSQCGFSGILSPPSCGCIKEVVVFGQRNGTRAVAADRKAPSIQNLGERVPPGRFVTPRGLGPRFADVGTGFAKETRLVQTPTNDQKPC